MESLLPKQLKAQFDKSFQAASLAGAVVAIKTDAAETWKSSAGNSDVDDTVLLNAGERFLIYSLTKTFISAAVLKLTEASLIALDIPFSTYLPDIPYSSQFTTRQVLNHSSGLPDYGSLPEYHEAVKRLTAYPWSFNEFIERTLRKGLAFAPGKGWCYSNIGYMLLRRLIERITDQKLGAAMQRLIFRPLNLDQTRLVNNRDDMSDLVVGHSLYLGKNGRNVDARDCYDPRWVAHGVLASTVLEVVTFYHELFEGRLLSRHSLDQMLEVINVGAKHSHFITPSYGLGVMADTDSPHGLLSGHTGEGPGYCGAAYHLRTPDGPTLTVSVLSNSENATAAEGLVMDLIGIFCRG